MSLLHPPFCCCLVPPMTNQYTDPLTSADRNNLEMNVLSLVTVRNLICISCLNIYILTCYFLLVVRVPEEASSKQQSYDYVILCVKALPDIYDLAGVIESVVTPQHTCILVNTTNTLGVEGYLEQRFPTNVVLSLVSGLDLIQTGVSEFEHMGSSELSVGPAAKNHTIPAQIQNDMAVALAITLGSAQIDCKVSENIRQEQYERMIG